MRTRRALDPFVPQTALIDISVHFQGHIRHEIQGRMRQVEHPQLAFVVHLDNQKELS